MLALIFAEVEDFKSAVVFAFSFQLPLHTDHALAGGVDGKFAKIARDPLPAKFFGDSDGSAGAAEKIGDEFTFVR